jgi:hypothetical protein
MAHAPLRLLLTWPLVLGTLPTSTFGADTDVALRWETQPAFATEAAPPPEESKDYLLPALEIVGFDTLLNLFDRAHYGCCDYDTNLSTIRRNLRSHWGVDSDSFTINQIGHPYQGSMYHGFARASGLGYWEASAYTFLGSAMWEIAGERTPPSRNDQISTGIGGSFLGEALYRMANLWLEEGRGHRFWRETAAAAISPPVAFNRLAFASRFERIFASRKPVYDSRLQSGVVHAVQNRPGTAARIQRNEAMVNFGLEYGIPGKRGYDYRRPFDYFTFQASASSAIGIEGVSTHGLLLGTHFKVGNGFDAIWGLYGSYDYMAPQIFRLASTAVSVGTTAKWRVSNSVVLQGTGLLGLGYATVSTLRQIANERANSYGAAPQALLALRATFGDRTAIDLSARDYFVSGISTGNGGGRDNIFRLDAWLTWRVHRRHALSLRYQSLERVATFPELGERSQRRQTIGIFYTLLGSERFRAAPEAIPE